jgi:hypothetical protein
MTEPSYKEIQAILEEAKPIEPKFMFGTFAWHSLGEVSKFDTDRWVKHKIDRLAIIVAETENYWIGEWFVSYGRMGVLFPKETTERLTEKEALEYACYDSYLKKDFYF